MADGNRRPKRFTAEQALQLLQLIDYDDSGDEGSIILNDVHVDQDSDPDEEAPPPIAETSEGDVLTSRAGIEWTNVTSASETGRAPARNIFRERVGPTAYSHRGIDCESALSAFRLFIDEPMLRSIQKYTLLHSQATGDECLCSLEDLEKFIGLQLARGVFVAKNTPLKDLWNQKWGPPIFHNTMSRNHFMSLMKHLRFDDITTRRIQNGRDKFLVSETWDAFIENCQKCYVPNYNLTIDEQLFPCKTRCPFTQYMTSKPDKFGLKFWLCIDVETK